MSSIQTSNRNKPDPVITDIAQYALNYNIKSSEAYNTARLCLMDTLGCGLEALSYPALNSWVQLYQAQPCKTAPRSRAPPFNSTQSRRHLTLDA